MLQNFGTALSREQMKNVKGGDEETLDSLDGGGESFFCSSCSSSETCWKPGQVCRYSSSCPNYGSVCAKGSGVWC